MRVLFKKKFNKVFAGLPIKIKEKFYSRLEIFVEDKTNAVLNNHSLEGVFSDCRSINITGDYRAIFYEEEDVVIFITIGTHSGLY